jgi:DNA-binding CsgD family transcriptional regulator
VVLNKRSGRKAIAREREKEALTLRIAGKSLVEIAKELQISESGARSAVERAIRRTELDTAQSVNEYRTVEVSRLDKMQAALWERCLIGEIDAINTVLRIIARRSSLLGLDLQPGEKHDAEHQLLVLLRAASERADAKARERVEVRSEQKQLTAGKTVEAEFEEGEHDESR